MAWNNIFGKRTFRDPVRPPHTPVLLREHLVFVLAVFVDEMI